LSAAVAGAAISPLIAISAIENELTTDATIDNGLYISTADIKEAITPATIASRKNFTKFRFTSDLMNSGTSAVIHTFARVP